MMIFSLYYKTKGFIDIAGKYVGGSYSIKITQWCLKNNQIVILMAIAKL